MSIRTHLGLLISLTAVGAMPVAAQNSSDKPAAPVTPKPPTATAGPGPSPALIARGDTVFHGPGNCYACHGTDAKGLVGPNLTDAEWIHSKGTYDEIVAQIQHGVPKAESKSGIEMPPKGGSSISDDDVKAVAAYVLSLGPKPGA